MGGIVLLYIWNFYILFQVSVEMQQFLLRFLESLLAPLVRIIFQNEAPIIHATDRVQE